MQLLYPLELPSERPPGGPKVDVDPRRNVVAVARTCIHDLAQDEG